MKMKPAAAFDTAAEFYVQGGSILKHNKAH